MVQGSTPSQMPVPLELMVLLEIRMLCTKSDSFQPHSGASSMAQIHQIEEDIIGNDPVAGLYKGPSPPHVPYNIVQDRKAIAIGGGAGHHIIKDHTVKALSTRF